MSQDSDHDLLIRINENLINALRSQTALEREFRRHEESDQKNFSFLNRTIWMGLGAVALLQVIFGLKLVFHG